MRRLISRATPEKWSRIGGRPRGKHTVSGWCTVSGCCRSWPRIFLFKYVLSTWLVCVATDAAAIAAGRRFFVFFVLPVSSFSARITQMLRAPFYKKTEHWTTHFRPHLHASFSLARFRPTLSSLWPELRHVIISTGAGTKNNYCTNLLDTSYPAPPLHATPLLPLLPLPPAAASPTLDCCFLPAKAAQLPFGCQFACIFYLLVLNACTLCSSACVCGGVWVCRPVCWCSYTRTRSNRAARASLQ